jgi:O-antigen/teichoic acid export membrane protein
MVGSLLRILSVFYFFSPDRYDIVGYFLFSQLIYLCVLLLGIRIAVKDYGYRWLSTLKSIRFTRSQYALTKSLAYSSFYVTVLWVLYIEFDPFVISKILGVEFVAYYAIGLTLFSFLRSLGATLYGPFQARFNHFVGLHDIEGLKRLFVKVITLLAPVITFGSLSIVLLAKPLVMDWVGPKYLASISVAELLVLGFSFQFLSQPTNILIISLEKVRYLYFVSTVMVVVYWAGVAATFRLFGLDSFAAFRTVSLFISAVVYLRFALRFLEMDLLEFGRRILLPLFPGVVSLFLILSPVSNLLPMEKGKLNLLLTVGAGMGGFLVSCLIYLISSGSFRAYLKEYIASFRLRSAHQGAV